MNNTELLQADYLDILFDKRNKQYGSYELRRHYNERTGKALLVLLGGLILALTVAVILAKNKTTTSVISRPVSIYIRKVYTIPATVLPKQSHPSPRLIAHTHATSAILVITNKPVEAAVQSNITTPAAATHNEGADIPGDVSTAGVPRGTGTAGPTVVPPPAVAKPMRWVAQMPEFIGDRNTYINSHLQYPDAAIHEGIQGTVIVRFVVNEDGSVSDAVIEQSVGSSFDEAALKMVMGMPRWKPGMQNGIPVKVYFTLPIKFMLN